MQIKKRKIIKQIIGWTITAGLSAGIIAGMVLNSNSSFSNLFAEIVVSDNTSVLADNSFSQSVYEGFYDFLKENNVEHLPDENPKKILQNNGIWRRPGATDQEREITYQGIFDSGKNLIIAPGFNHANPISNVSSKKNYENKGFLLLDSYVASHNVASVLFRSEQAGFLTGIATAQFLNDNHEIFANPKFNDNELKVGAFVGVAYNTTLDYLTGFQKGIFSWNKSIEQNPSRKKVKWIFLGDEIQTYSSGGFNIGGGRTISLSLINSGADIIFPIAGPQVNDSVIAASEAKRPVCVVGVDSVQEYSTFNKIIDPDKLDGKKIKNTDGSESSLQTIIQFSATKKLDIATLNCLKATRNPNNLYPYDSSGAKEAEYGGFGYLTTCAIGEKLDGPSGISVNGLQYFLKAIDVNYELKLDENKKVIDCIISDQDIPKIKEFLLNDYFFKELYIYDGDPKPNDFITFYFQDPVGKSPSELENIKKHIIVGLKKYDKKLSSKYEQYMNDKGEVIVKDHLNGSNWEIVRK